MPRFGARNHRIVPKKWEIPALAVLVLGAAVVVGLWWHRAAPAGPLDRGLAAYDRRDWQAAERQARERLKSHGDDADAQRLLARSLFRLGRDQAALASDERLPRERMGAEDNDLQGEAFRWLTLHSPTLSSASILAPNRARKPAKTRIINRTSDASTHPIARREWLAAR